MIEMLVSYLSDPYIAWTWLAIGAVFVGNEWRSDRTVRIRVPRLPLTKERREMHIDYERRSATCD